jgi:hypothetical protein
MHRDPKSTFHPKLYLFDREASTVAIIGSSNLTAGGLSANIEANVRIEGHPASDVIMEARRTFERYFQHELARPLSLAFAERYREVRELNAQAARDTRQDIAAAQKRLKTAADGLLVGATLTIAGVEVTAPLHDRHAPAHPSSALTAPLVAEAGRLPGGAKRHAPGGLRRRYGYETDGYTEIPEEHAVIADVRAWIGEGLNGVAIRRRILDNAGPAPHAWSAPTVERLIARLRAEMGAHLAAEAPRWVKPWTWEDLDADQVEIAKYVERRLVAATSVKTLVAELMELFPWEAWNRKSVYSVIAMFQPVWVNRFTGRHRYGSEPPKPAEPDLEAVKQRMDQVETYILGRFREGAPILGITAEVNQRYEAPPRCTKWDRAHVYKALRKHGIEGARDRRK